MRTPHGCETVWISDIFGSYGALSIIGEDGHDAIEDFAWEADHLMLLGLQGLSEAECTACNWPRAQAMRAGHRGLALRDGSWW